MTDAANPAGASASPGWERVSEEQAARYAQHVAPTFVTLARRAVDLAEIEPGHTVLDLCTGTGIAAFLAAERAARDGSVIGLDASPAMLAIARERATSVGYEHINWQEGDAQQLTYADESFDAVLCVQALMLLERPDAALEEVRREGTRRPPKHLRDAHYAGAKRLGHGVGYRYPHSDPQGAAGQQYLPDELAGRRFYEPDA